MRPDLEIEFRGGIVQSMSGKKIEIKGLAVSIDRKIIIIYVHT